MRCGWRRRWRILPYEAVPQSWRPRGALYHAASTWRWLPRDAIRSLMGGRGGLADTAALGKRGSGAPERCCSLLSAEGNAKGGPMSAPARLRLKRVALRRPPCRISLLASSVRALTGSGRDPARAGCRRESDTWSRPIRSLPIARVTSLSRRHAVLP